MKTILLVSNSAQTQRLLTEAIGQKANIVLLPALADTSRSEFDSHFQKWSKVTDTVIIDAISLGNATSDAISSLTETNLNMTQSVIVRTSSKQQSVYHIPHSWLVIGDNDSIDQLKQTFTGYFQRVDLQRQFEQANAVISRQKQLFQFPNQNEAYALAGIPVTAHPSRTTADESYRYRDALKHVSQILGEGRDEESVLQNFALALRELLGVGKLLILRRPIEIDIVSNKLRPNGNKCTVAACVGVSEELARHLFLQMDSGIAKHVDRTSTILRRLQLHVNNPQQTVIDPQAELEFDRLGTEIAVPIFDTDQLMGVLTFSGKIIGTPFQNEELELIYHLGSQLAQCIRNIHLVNRVEGQTKLMAEVFTHVQSGVIVVRSDKKILEINRAAKGLLDVVSDEVGYLSLDRIPSEISSLLTESIKGQKPVRQREVKLSSTNRYVSVSVTHFSIAPTAPNCNNSSAITVALIEDLTQLKLQESKAKQQADNEFFERLSSRLSHELKNSLVSIKIFAQLLPERYKEKEFREQFSKIVVNEVNRVDMQVNNLTFFGQPLTLVHEDHVLADLMDASIDNVAREFARKRTANIIRLGETTPSDLPTITVKTQYAHQIPCLEGDKIRLMQALEHVFRNAVQSMPTGGLLLINTADAQSGDFPSGNLPEGGAVRIECQDTGEGISSDNLELVTEPFVTTRNVGVGLGLTIVKKIVQRHGGVIEIDSMLGRGTTVVIVLPWKATQTTHEELKFHKREDTNGVFEKSSISK